MKANWKDIGLIVAIALNVFQFISDEAKDWYSLTKQPEPSINYTDNIDIGYRSKGEGVYRDEVKQIAKGVE